MATATWPWARQPKLMAHATETVLEPGDAIFLYTDGVTDALNPQDERLGEAAARRHLSAGPASLVADDESLIQLVNSHAAGRAQFDDTTVVAFGRTRVRVWIQCQSGSEL
jgi:sigma-B regulation protein RsbU (phosphoserine phosphatase)